MAIEDDVVTIGQAERYFEIGEHYTALEYIQSSGVQYIDTGFIPSSNTRIVYDMERLSKDPAEHFFGVRTGSQNLDGFTFYIYNSGWRSGYGTDVQGLNGPSTGRYLIDKNRNICTINETTVMTNPEQTFICSDSLLLFAMKNIGMNPGYGSHRLYSCKIYDNDVLIRDFVPARRSSDLAVGLYDIMNYSFYTNSGSGTFIVGPDSNENINPPIYNTPITLRQLKALIDETPATSIENEFDTLLVTVEQINRIPILHIVSWSDGTDQQIADMVAAADSGLINLSDYWHEGDTRMVTLSAMSAGDGVDESHAEQTVEFVLSDPSHFVLENGSSCHFVVNQKNILNTTGYMQSTNDNGWHNSQRRAWCNNTYRNAIPETLRSIFKKFNNISSSGGNRPTVRTSVDYFSIPSEKEIFGETTYANSTIEASNSQFNYYKTASNRSKSKAWWTRSSDGVYQSVNSFAYVKSDGSESGSMPSSRYAGISPFGCI